MLRGVIDALEFGNEAKELFVFGAFFDVKRQRNVVVGIDTPRQVQLAQVAQQQFLGVQVEHALHVIVYVC